MTRFTLTSDSIRAREMELSNSFRAFVSIDELAFSLRRDSRSLPPSSAKTII